MRHSRVFLPLCFSVAALMVCISVHAANPGSSPAERAGLPPVDSALKITHAYAPATYPRVSFGLGGAIAFLNNSALETSVNELLSTYGVGGADFAQQSMGFYSTVRVQISKRVGVWADGVLTSGINHDYEGKSHSRSAHLSSYSFGALITVARSPKEAVALSVGAGVAVQKLQTYQDINVGISEGRILEDVTINSGKVTGFPVEALLDIGNPGKSGFGLFLSARYIFSPDASITQNIYENNTWSSATIKMSMSGLRLSGGVSLTL